MAGLRNLKPIPSSIGHSFLQTSDHDYLVSNVNECFNIPSNIDYVQIRVPTPGAAKIKKPTRDTAEIKSLSASTLTKWLELRDSGGFTDNDTFCSFLLQAEELRQASVQEGVEGASELDLNYLVASEQPATTTNDDVPFVVCSQDNRAVTPAIQSCSSYQQTASAPVITSNILTPREIENVSSGDIKRKVFVRKSGGELIQFKTVEHEVESPSTAATDEVAVEIDEPMSVEMFEPFTPSTPNKSRKARGLGRLWDPLKTFTTQEEAEAYIKSLQHWTTVGPATQTGQGRVRYFRCNLVSFNAPVRCPAALRTMHYHDNADEVVLYRADCEHNHTYLKNRGIPLKVREEIVRLYNNNVKRPLAIMRHLQRTGFTPPKIRQLHNYMARMFHSRRVFGTLKCTECERLFTSREGLARHIRVIHRGDEAGRATKAAKLAAAERPFGCDVCDKWFMTKAAWRSHYRSHQNGYEVGEAEETPAYIVLDNN